MVSSDEDPSYKIASQQWTTTLFSVSCDQTLLDCILTQHEWLQAFIFNLVA